jgi:hypothetical protein
MPPRGAGLSSPAIDSWRYRKDTNHLGNRLPVLQPVGEHAQGQCLRSMDGVLTRLAVRQKPAEFNNLGKPSAIVFLLDFDRKGHIEFASAPCPLPELIPHG